MKINKTVKRILIAFLALSSIFYVLVIFIFLSLVGFIEINIKNKTDYLVLWEWWWNQDRNGESVIDLAKVMPFEWDYFVVCDSDCDVKNIERELSVEGRLSEIKADRKIVFIKNNKVVFSEVWYKQYNVLHNIHIYPKGIIYFTDSCFYVNKDDAKFKAKKNEKGNLILDIIE
jgi:hypothetical protein